MAEQRSVVAGFDVGGAHLKVARAEAGAVAAAAAFAMPLWHGLDRLDAAFAAAAPLWRDAERFALTMTGELADIFPSRAAGVSALIAAAGKHLPADRTAVYAGPAGFLDPGEAARRPLDVASANWHATAALVAQRLGSEALFADMGSTTTDLVALAGGRPVNRGFSDAERLAAGELIYTGFSRSLLFSVAAEAPVRGRLTPLMNEYFAAMADVHRVLGVLDEGDDLQATADGREKTLAASLARLARMVALEPDALDLKEWRTMAAWFSERQLRLLHDAAVRVAAPLAAAAPVVAAGSGRWQVARLAARLERPLIAFADLVPCRPAAAADVASAAPACAVALLDRRRP